MVRDESSSASHGVDREGAIRLMAETLPLSGYSGALGKTDSPFLTAVFRLETAVGTATLRSLRNSSTSVV